jgi:DNA-binding transcriptional regulator YiaG
MEVSLDEERMAQRIGRVRQEPSFPIMLDVVRAMSDCVVASGSLAGVSPDKLRFVTDVVLQNNAFQICSVKIPPPQAVEIFRGYVTSVFNSNKFSAVFIDPSSLTNETLSGINFQECFEMYNLAVYKVVTEQVTTAEGQQILRSMMASLNLSFDELGRIFRVSGETIRRWENGTNGIPDDRNAEITLTQGPLNKLLEIIRPAKLPQAIRRKVPLFEGESALDWILRGRIADVANRYETALRYQA